MGPGTLRRRALKALGAPLVAGAALAAEPAAAEQDTTFLDMPELARRLLVDVVRVRTSAGSQHGFGLVVGRNARQVYVATAGHVLEGPADQHIEADFCDPSVPAAAVTAERVSGFDGGGADVALLVMPRPAGYEPQMRLLADEGLTATGQEAALLGQAGQCGLVPRRGAVARLRDARGNLRVEFSEARGGSSGGPVLTGYGVVGLITEADDLTFTAYSAGALAERVVRQVPGAWQAEAARNIPPTDPRAAQVDLAETLNKFLFSVQNLRGLLLQRSIPQKLYFDFSRDYNDAISRFRDARDRYDGTLQRDWPPDVLPAWIALRDRVWAVHQNFWKLNEGDSKRIFEDRRAPESVRSAMLDLAPAMGPLEADINAFLKTLGTRRHP